MARLTVLMYHAVAEGEAARLEADPHYSVTPAAFGRHVDAIGQAGLAMASVADVVSGRAPGAQVAFTFDDGHESNARAAIRLREAGGNADLFVNPGRVGQRGFLDWQALADLAKAGVSIQSHGQNHRYLDDLDEAAIRRELHESKSALEAGIGSPVTLFAPPGGRLTPRVPAIARELGYRGLCTSRPGLWASGGSPWSIPRLAVLAGTGEATFDRWIRQDSGEIVRLRVRHAALASAKRVLGNRLYERARLALLGTEPRA